MRKLKAIVAQLESYSADFEKSNPSVSNATIGWQIDHSLLVINSVIEQLKNSNPDHYKWRFNKMRIFIQIINTIPRGKVRAPKLVNPMEMATFEDLNAKLELAKKNISDLEKLPAKSYFTHPFFGDLNLKSTIWFLKLHTKHHLKIIQDI